jgi:pullulanase/glycogen debranching enzyme
MMVMGDELAKSHGGNNNWYGHDNAMSHMQWDVDRDEGKAALLHFMSELVRWRVQHPLLGRAEFLG